MRIMVFSGTDFSEFTDSVDRFLARKEIMYVDMHYSTCAIDNEVNYSVCILYRLTDEK